MSGGAYDYLCFADDEQLFGYLEHIDKVGKRLRELGYPDHARYTERVAAQLRWAVDDAHQLQSVWHAVEWLDSGDWEEERFRSEMESATAGMYRTGVDG
jgi:hypothetical protein